MRGALYVALKVLGDQAAAAQVKVFKWHPEARMAGDRAAREPLAYDHPISKLVVRPNRWETGGMLRRRRVHQLCLTGTNLQWRVDDGLGTPVEMWNIPTGTYQPVAASSVYPNGAYRVMPWFPGPLAMIPGALSAGGVVVPTEHMVKTMMPHPLVQWEGLSPLSACELSLDTIESIDRARMSKTRREIVPSCVITADPQVTFPKGDELTRLREEIFQLMGGPDKAGRPALLGPGLEIEPWGGGNIEVGWIESWGQLVDFVLSVFGVTKSLAFMSEETNFAALYAALRQFNLFSLCPLLQLMADSDNLGLVWPHFGEDYFIEYEPQSITNEDQAIAECKTLMGGQGGATWNEVRQKLGWEPTEEEWGNERASASPPKPEMGGAGGPKPGGALEGKKEGEDGMTPDWFGVREEAKPEERGQSREQQRARPRNRQGVGAAGSQPSRWKMGGRLKSILNGVNGNGVH